MHEMVKLSKEGLFGEKWSKRLEDYVVEGIRAGGRKKGEFFFFNSHTQIKIEGKVTLLDLIKIMADMNADELHALSTISNANLAPYLIDFASNPDPIPDDDAYGKLTAIEVYKSVELDNHESGDELFDLSVSTCAHGIGEIWEDCMKEVREGKKKLDDVKDCNSYAIEFTPWQKMLDLPIQIRPLIYHTEIVWKPCKPRKWEIGILGSKRKFNMGRVSRDIVERKADKKVRGPMSLSEFFTGLFNELCFFGSPVSRDDQKKVLDSRVKDVEKSIKKRKK